MGLKKLLSQAKRAFHARHHVFKTHPDCCNKTSTENKKSSWAYISLNHHSHPHQTLHEQIFCIKKSPHLPCKETPLLLHPHDDIRICNYIFAHYNDMNYTKPNSCAVILCSQVQTRFSGVISVAPRVCPTLPSETAHGLKSLAAHSVIEKKSSIFYIRNMFHTLYCTTTT